MLIVVVSIVASTIDVITLTNCMYVCIGNAFHTYFTCCFIFCALIFYFCTLLSNVSTNIKP